MKKLIFTILLCLALCALVYIFIPKETKRIVQFVVSRPRVLLIQPLGDFNRSLASENLSNLKRNFPSSRLLSNSPLPQKAYYRARDRYRADSILNTFRYHYGVDTVLLLMTHSDISVTKKQIKDWGIMGLAHRPGSVCVVSTYRLDKSKLAEQLYKVSIHELGHTQGLPHCPIKSCYMRDASGGNPLDEEIEFCSSCKKIMEKKGWNI